MFGDTGFQQNNLAGLEDGDSKLGASDLSDVLQDQSTILAADPYAPNTIVTQAFEANMPNFGCHVIPVRGVKPATERKQATDDGKVAEADWLKDVVQKRPGWETFFKGINHSLQNPDAARLWRFAVAFANEFNKTESRAPVGHFCFYFISSNLNGTDRAGQTNLS